MKLMGLKSGVVGVACAVALFSTAQADTIFVDDDAPLGGDGSSWRAAYKFLQDALADAVGGTEIRVAQGVYVPDRDEAGNVTAGDREATFQLLDGVAVLGGFAGITEPDPNARDVELFETILSGDLLQDDTLIPCGSRHLRIENNDENSYHIVTSTAAVGVLLDGLTIRGGNASSHPLHKEGAGVYAQGGSLTITHCTITDNNCWAGCGIWSSASLTITRTSFVLNGDRCLIVGAGGAIFNDGDLTATSCIFDRNAIGVGGGIWNDCGTTATITNCLFIGNHADFGGGIANLPDSELTAINCTFTGNSAGHPPGGSALATTTSQSTLFNCIVWDNLNYSQIYGDLTINFGDVEGGWTGAGLGNIDADPLFVDPINGVLRLSPGSPCIDAGNNWGVSPDTADLDEDGDTLELTPWDLDGNPRFVHAAVGTHPGCGIPAVVDMGAYEFQDGKAADIKLGDIDGDGTVGIVDFGILLASWGACEPGCCLADLDIDGNVGITDFLLLLGNWG